jgi:hypothetical protein
MTRDSMAGYRETKADRLPASGNQSGEALTVDDRNEVEWGRGVRAVRGDRGVRLGHGHVPR